MSHLVLKRIDGKWRLYDKHKKQVEGPRFSDYAKGEEYRKHRDEKEDAQIERGARIENKEHPEFPKKSAKQIALDHLKEHPDMYKKGQGGGDGGNMTYNKITDSRLKRKD